MHGCLEAAQGHWKAAWWMLLHVCRDVGLLLTGLPLCLATRAANIFPLSRVANMHRKLPLPVNLQVRLEHNSLPFYCCLPPMLCMHAQLAMCPSCFQHASRPPHAMMTPSA